MAIITHPFLLLLFVCLFGEVGWVKESRFELTISVVYLYRSPPEMPLARDVGARPRARRTGHRQRLRPSHLPAQLQRLGNDVSYSTVVLSPRSGLGNTLTISALAITASWDDSCEG